MLNVKKLLEKILASLLVKKTGSWYYATLGNATIAWGIQSFSVANTVSSPAYGGYRSNEISGTMPAGIFTSKPDIGFATKQNSNSLRVMSLTPKSATSYGFLTGSAESVTSTLNLGVLLIQFGGGIVSPVFSRLSAIGRWWEHAERKGFTDKDTKVSVQGIRPNRNGIDCGGKQFLHEPNMGLCNDNSSLRRAGECVGRDNINQWLGISRSYGKHYAAVLQILGDRINKRKQDTNATLALAYLISERGCCYA